MKMLKITTFNKKTHRESGWTLVFRMLLFGFFIAFARYRFISSF